MSAPEGFEFHHSDVLVYLGVPGSTVNVYFNKEGVCYCEVVGLDEFNVDREAAQYFDKIYMAELGIKV